MGQNPDDVTPQRRSKLKGSDGNTAGQAKLLVASLVVVVLGYYALTSMFQPQVLLPPPTPDKGPPPIVGTPTVVVPVNPPSETGTTTNVATNSSQPERDRPKSADNHKAELTKKFGEDKVVTVTIKKAAGDPVAIDRYLNRRLFRAAYQDYKSLTGQSSSAQRSERAKQEAFTHAIQQPDLGPLFIRFRYKLISSDVPYPEIVAGSRAAGTFVYYVAPVGALEQFIGRCEIGENPTIDHATRTVTVEAQLPTPIPDPDVEELYLQYGRESVAKIRVLDANGQKDTVLYFLESQTEQLDPAVNLAVAGGKSVGPGKFELHVAPVVDLKGLADRVTYGTVNDIESTVRMITIDAKIPQNLQPRPSPAEFAMLRSRDWDRLWGKPSSNNDKPPEGDEFYAWVVRKLRGPHGDVEAALSELKLKKVDEAHRQQVADVLISTLKQSSNIPEQLDAMVVWKNDATERAIIGLIGNLQHHRYSPVIMAALVKMGTKESARAISMGLTDSTYGEDASRSLIEMGSIAEEFAVKFADNRDDSVRTRVYDVLAAIGTEKSIPKLRGNITKEKDPFMKERVKETIDKIKQRADDAKATADPDSPFSTKPKN